MLQAKTDKFYKGNNCKKGNRPCPGYELDMKLRDEGPKIRQRYQRKPLSDVEDACQPASPKYQIETFSPSKLVSISQSNSYQSNLSDALGPGPHEEKVQGDLATIKNSECMPVFALADLNRTPEERCTSMMARFMEPKLYSILPCPDLEQQQLLHIFTSSIAPPALDRSTAGVAALPNHGRWLARLPPLTGSNKLLDSAVRAVALAHLGLVHGLKSFLIEARPLYGKALHLLSLALGNSTEALSAETLGATILLSLYEIFASNSSKSWLQHAGGASALIRIRGPARHRYGFHRELYLAYRHTLVTEACRSRVHCFLEEPEWRKLAAHVNGDRRTSSQVDERLENFNTADAFHGEFIRIAGVLCDAGNLTLHASSACGTGSSMKREITVRAESIRTNVKCTFARLSSTLRNLGQGPISYASDDRVFPVYYNDVNISVALLHNIYRGMLMLLNLILKEMDPCGPTAGLYMLEAREAALDCCRSESFMVTSAFHGPFFIVQTLRFALAVLEPGAERNWILGKLFILGETKMAMAKHGTYLDPANPLPEIRFAVEEAGRMEKISLLDMLPPTALILGD